VKHLSSTSMLLAALVLLCGCGGGGKPSLPPLTPPPLVPNIAGNWQFSATSVKGIPPITFAGSFAESHVSVSAAVHVDDSTCFDRLTTIGLTGTLTGRDISLTSPSVDGQVATFTGVFTPTAFTGTYAINGGCGDGDQGSVTGVQVPAMVGSLSGTFTTSHGEAIDVAGWLDEDAASPEGSFGLEGTVAFNDSCLVSGTVTTGAFPTHSFILGTFVSLEIETANGTVAFLGTLNSSGQISGTYTLASDRCDDSGTALLKVSNPWDY
jgi:hypothetical protein